MPSWPAHASLVTRFALMTVAALAVLGVVLAQLLHGQIKARALNSAEEAASLVARAGVQADLTPEEIARGFSPRRLAELDRRLQVDGFGASGIERVKIFNTEPSIIYSDDRTKIGMPGSPAIERALRGEVVSKFVRGVDHTDEGGRTLEVMVPLQFAGDARPAGVYEVYLSYANTEAAIRKDTLTMYGVIAGGLALLFLALHRIVALASRRLRHQATHDALTGLPNRLLLHDRLERALAASDRTGDRVAVMLIDLDRFKEINDTLGHSYGDELLRQIAPRLQDVLRHSDTLARLGGDEFAVLLPAVPDRAIVQAVAERLRAALHRSFDADGMRLDVEASIGVAISPDDGTATHALLRNADIAMYVAKDRKAGAVFFEAEDHVSTPLRLTALGDLRRALETDDQLFLHYQPKFALDDERFLGVEALLRWQHPERGLVPPADFIGVAEGTGLINQITERVLQLALAQTRRWLDAGHEVPVAVNLSTRCLLDAGLPDLVAGLLAAHGVPAALLRLEITESAVMGDAARASDVLARLHAQGVHLSIDDFGTGYTSMAYLRRLPVNELKVDRSFVMGMIDAEQDEVLVRTAIDLGHNLGLTVVAEGVEGPEHVAALRALNCDIAQGFHFARPMPAEAITELLPAVAVTG
jgi:diguanylate cyclase (GGDEF)-like protein